MKAFNICTLFFVSFVIAKVSSNETENGKTAKKSFKESKSSGRLFSPKSLFSSLSGSSPFKPVGIPTKKIGSTLSLPPNFPSKPISPSSSTTKQTLKNKRRIPHERLLISFTKNCNTDTESKRALHRAAKFHISEKKFFSIYGQQLNALTSSGIYVDKTGSEHFDAYTEVTYSLFEPLVGVDGIGFQVIPEHCKISRVNLKNVGVNIVDLSKCEFLDDEIVKNEFEHIDCATNVEHDSIITLDDFEQENIKNSIDIEKKSDIHSNNGHIRKKKNNNLTQESTMENNTKHETGMISNEEKKRCNGRREKNKHPAKGFEKKVELEKNVGSYNEQSTNELEYRNVSLLENDEIISADSISSEKHTDTNSDKNNHNKNSINNYDTTNTNSNICTLKKNSKNNHSNENDQSYKMEGINVSKNEIGESRGEENGAIYIDAVEVKMTSETSDDAIRNYEKASKSEDDIEKKNGMITKNDNDTKDSVGDITAHNNTYQETAGENNKDDADDSINKQNDLERIIDFFFEKIGVDDEQKDEGDSKTSHSEIENENETSNEDDMDETYLDPKANVNDEKEDSKHDDTLDRDNEENKEEGDDDWLDREDIELEDDDYNLYRSTRKKNWDEERYDINRLRFAIVEKNKERMFDHLKNQRDISFQELEKVIELYYPNDPYISNQYHHDKVNSYRAWGLSQGNKDTIVAIIDTGIDYYHEDLAENIYINTKEIPYNGIDDDNNGFIDDIYGFDFRTNTGISYDEHGHGTHVAGIVGGIGNNKKGVSGLCWNIKMLSLKFMDESGSGKTSDAIKALNYAIAMRAKVSCNSWGGPDFSNSLVTAIENAKEKGHLIVAAAGNQWNNTDKNPHYPASYKKSNIISVAATNSDDELADFSNYGTETVHLGAPGEDILSTFKRNSYRRLSGTSMATPIVAAVAAMIWSEFPTLSHQKIRKALIMGAETLPSLEGKIKSGSRLNAFRSVTIAAMMDYMESRKQAKLLKKKDEANEHQRTEAEKTTIKNKQKRS